MFAVAGHHQDVAMHGSCQLQRSWGAAGARRWRRQPPPACRLSSKLGSRPAHSACRPHCSLGHRDLALTVAGAPHPQSPGNPKPLLARNFRLPTALTGPGGYERLLAAAGRAVTRGGLCSALPGGVRAAANPVGQVRRRREFPASRQPPHVQPPVRAKAAGSTTASCSSAPPPAPASRRSSHPSTVRLL